MNADITHDREITGTITAPDGTPRQFRVGQECGDLFVEDIHFDGLTLTLEVSSLEEGMALVALFDTR